MLTWALALLFAAALVLIDLETIIIYPFVVVATFLHAKKTKDEFLEFAGIVWDLEQSAQQQPLGRN